MTHTPHSRTDPQDEALAGSSTRTETKASASDRPDRQPHRIHLPTATVETVGEPGFREVKPNVLLVFRTRFDDSAAMLRGIAHYERAHTSWRMLLDDEGRSEFDSRWIRSRRWDGVISRHATPALVRACAELGIPMVDLGDGPSQPHVSKIRPDHAALGHVGAEYFLECGYRNFAFCGYKDVAWSRERRDGFVEALALAGHGCEQLEIEHLDDPVPFWEGVEADAITLWVRRLPRRVAVMACSDLCALHVVRAAEAAGILVPEQMGVLGANNDTIRCELANPPISSIAANSFQSGYEAARHLDALMSGKSCGRVDLRIEPGGVIARKSTNVLAVADLVVAKALSYIADNACRGLTVDEVLKHVLVSRSKLESRFRRHVGRSPQVEIRRVQVARITQLLMETDLPLVEIAEQTGFVHVEYMCVLFKRFTGDSPGRYRRKRQVEPVAV